ncbi:MAG: class I SAM-dependent methyltransferase [Pseudomonadota bacterium]
MKKPLNATQKKELARIDAVVAQMLEDGDALLSRPLLLERLRQLGLSHNNWGGLAAYQDWYNVSLAGCMQVPTELVDFLLYAAKTQPKSMIEVGVFTGGTALFAAAFFKAVFKDFDYVCLDIKDQLLILPETEKRLGLRKAFGKTSDDFAGQSFDVVFIDGDHSFKWAKRDYLNLGRHAAKICAFHDINAKEYLPQGGGVYTFWRHLRSTAARDMAVVELCHSPAHVGVQNDGCWMGIGILDMTSR